MSNQFIQMKKKGNKLFPKTLVIGIDVNNVLFSGNPKPNPYIAIQDCVVMSTFRSEGCNLYIDNINIWQQNASVGIPPIYLKKGQTLSINTNFDTPNNWNILVYGLKYI